MVEQTDVGSNVRSFIAIVFILLGALFGMMIMAVIFGNLNESTSSLFDKDPGSVVNETGFINDSGYTLARSVNPGFSDPVIVIAVNASSNVEIAGSAFAVSSIGVVTNLTTAGGLFDSVNFTYTFQADSKAKILSESVGNNSLGAIETYTEQADTQFSTAAIAIILLILISLFAIFWKFFIGGTKGGDGGGITPMGGGGGGGRRRVASGRGSFS